MKTTAQSQVPCNSRWSGKMEVVASYGIIPEDIPDLLNRNQHMKIDGVTGNMEHTQVRPTESHYLDIGAEKDLQVALSASRYTRGRQTYRCTDVRAVK